MACLATLASQISLEPASMMPPSARYFDAGSPRLQRVEAEGRMGVETSRIAQYYADMEHKQQELAAKRSHELKLKKLEFRKERERLKADTEKYRIDKETAAQVEIARLEAEARVLAAKAAAEVSAIQTQAQRADAASDSSSVIQSVMSMLTTLLSNQSKQLSELTRVSAAESRKRGRDDSEELD